MSMEQKSLFKFDKPTSISVHRMANKLNVSTASVRNWIKAGYLEQVGRGIVSCRSFDKFRVTVIGTEKLNKRANKIHGYQHDHAALCASIRKTIVSNDTSSVGGKLSDLYENTLSSSFKNQEGIFYTPIKVCRTFFNWLPEDKSSLIFCDPCCGSGNFLIVALEAGFRPENVIGYDTDEIAVEIACKRITELSGYEKPNVHVADFLSLTTSCDNPAQQYDVIFTNPPWGKKLPKTDKEKLARKLGHNKSVDTCALFFLACMSNSGQDGYFGMLLPDAFFNVRAFMEIRRILLKIQIISLRDFDKLFPGLVTKAKSFVARNREADGVSNIHCETAHGSHERSQNSFEKSPNSILNFSVRPDEAEAISHMMSIQHDTLAGNAKWALGIVTGNNNKFVTKEPVPGYIPVQKGADITRNGLREPSCYIPGEMELYQQVAPLHLYEAKEKLLYKFISSELVFYYDTGQHYILNSANLLIVDDFFPVNMEILSDYLSSDLINWFYKRVFETHKVLRSDIEKIPIYSKYICTMSTYDEDQLLALLNMERKTNGSYGLEKQDLFRVQRPCRRIEQNSGNC